MGGPGIGRLADRLGHRPVLPVAALGNAVLLALLVAAVLAETPLPVQVAIAGLAGLTVPQIGPLSRTRWISLGRHRPGDAELVGRALSFDTTVDEVSFMVGPAPAGLLVVTVHPVAGLLLAAVLIAVFGVLFALHPTAPRGVPTARSGGGPTLVSPALLALFAMATFQGLILGSANAGPNALAAAEGNTGLAGLIWGGMAVTSTAAGLVIVGRSAGTDLVRTLRVAIAAQALFVLPLLLGGGLWGTAGTVAVLGLAIAPHLIAIFGLAERVAPIERMAEAMTLLGNGLIIGQGAAAVAAGQLAGGYGYTAAFGLTCTAAAVAALVAVTVVRRSALPGPGPTTGVLPGPTTSEPPPAGHPSAPGREPTPEPTSASGT
ncbi:MFS transporter [Embleya sp. NPDC020886]|uniref:MFS transporter n=1 Tax=Embleya sp. NPDC020886 TaxID=3363980 RepID=UPI0037A43FCE